MAAMLGLILSMLVTAALIGWLVAEAERPAPRRRPPAWRREADHM